MYETKLNKVSETTQFLLKNQLEIKNNQKNMKVNLLSLKDFFSSEFGNIINDLSRIIESVEKTTKTNKSEEDDDESPAGKHEIFKNDEIFNITRDGTNAWELYTLADPMILNQIYKLRIKSFKSCTNSYAINVGVSVRKLFKFYDSGISQTYGYLVKNGKKWGGCTNYSEPAEEGDIIGVSISEGDNDKYNLEIFKNGINLGVAFKLDKKDYYFFYGLCENTSIEISDCYNHYNN